MPKAIKYFINVLFLICFFICVVSFRNKLVIIFYLQATFNMNYDVLQLQRGSLNLFIITICRIGMSGDVEENPGSKRNSCQNQTKVSLFLISLISHIYQKLFLIPKF